MRWSGPIGVGLVVSIVAGCAEPETRPSEANSPQASVTAAEVRQRNVERSRADWAEQSRRQNLEIARAGWMRKRGHECRSHLDLAACQDESPEVTDEMRSKCSSECSSSIQGWQEDRLQKAIDGCVAAYAGGKSTCDVIPPPKFNGEPREAIDCSAKCDELGRAKLARGRTP